MMIHTPVTSGGKWEVLSRYPKAQFQKQPETSKNSREELLVALASLPPGYGEFGLGVWDRDQDGRGSRGL